MSKTEEKPVSTEQTIKKTYSFFDENLVEQEKEVEVKFTPAADYKSAVERLGNDEASLLSGLNYVLKRNAIAEAKKNAGIAGGINRAVLMEFIKPWREIPSFASMISTSDKRKATAEEWNAQTNAILAQIKNIPPMIEAIKARSAEADNEE